MNKFWNFKDTTEDEAELYLYGEISTEELWWSDDVVAYKTFIQELKDLGVKNLIKVYINSGGGDVFAANSIYTQLKLNKAKIHVIVDGICASAATIVAMAGDKISISNGGMVMVHNPKLYAYGYYEQRDLEKLNDVLNTVKASIISAYKTRLKKTDEELAEIMNNETWYTANEAIQNGLADELLFNDISTVVNNKHIIVNNIPFDIKNYKNIPNSLKNEVVDKYKSSTFFNTKTQKGAEKEVEIKNVEELVKNYPDLVNQIIEITKNDVLSEERARLEAIDEISSNIPIGLVIKAKYKDCITAEQLAYQAIKNNQGLGKRIFENMKTDSQNNNLVVGTNDGNSELEKKEKINSLVNFLNTNKKGGK